MPDEKDKTAAAQDKAAADRAHVAQGAASEAATSVAEAVKRVADAAVVEVQKSKTAPAPGDFVFSGSPGGRFRIDGSGFGTNGTVKLNGVQLHANEWGASHIAGNLPADATAGEVTVHIDDKTVKRGYARF